MRYFKGMSRSRLSYSLLALAVLALGPTPMIAHAAGGGGGEGAEENSNKTVEFAGLVLPVERDGKLVNYLFVSVQVTLSPKYDQWEVREMAHVYRDHILKEAHKTTVGLADKPMMLDEHAFEDLMKRVFDDMLGPESVAAIKIVTVDSQKVFLDG